MTATELREHVAAQIEAASTSLDKAGTRDVLRHVDGALPQSGFDRAFYVTPVTGVQVPPGFPVPCPHRWQEFLVTVFYSQSPSAIARASEDAKFISDKFDHLAASHADVSEATHDGGVFNDISETAAAMEWTLSVRFTWG